MPYSPYAQGQNTGSQFTPQRFSGGIRGTAVTGPANFMDWLRRQSQQTQRPTGGQMAYGQTSGGRTSPGFPDQGGGLGLSQAEIDLIRQNTADDARRLQQAAMGARDVAGGQFQERGLANSTLAQGAQDVINREEMQGLGELGRGAQDRIMALISQLARDRQRQGSGGGGRAGGAAGGESDLYERYRASGAQRGTGGSLSRTTGPGRQGSYFGALPVQQDERDGLAGNVGGFE